jgi:hypothetical protein
MKHLRPILTVFCAGIACITAQAQMAPGPDPAATPAMAQPNQPPSPPAPGAPAGVLDLNWTPPAFAQLNSEASTRSSFNLDRNALSMASGLISSSDVQTRQIIAKLDGVSVHILRFAPGGIPDQRDVADLRQAYHLRGWKHLVTNTAFLPASTNAKDPLHNGTTDLWLEMDGMNVRGAVALVESPKSLTLITLAGNISPVDLLHLRGHFGIPKFDGDQFKTASNR